ncbi:MAG: hypothetical protein AAF456_12125 [Planctomycetota bacterium]
MRLRNTVVAILTALVLCPLTFAEIPGSSSGSTSHPDNYLDYRIEIQEIQTGVYFLKYDTHAPIVHLSQINIKRKAFNSKADADDFIAANPGFSILDRGYGIGAENSWLEIDSTGTYAQALARKDQLRADNNHRLRVRIIPFLSYSYGFGISTNFSIMP